MKSKFIVVLIILFLILLLGCKNNENNGSQIDEDNSDELEQKEQLLVSEALGCFFETYVKANRNDARINEACINYYYGVYNNCVVATYDETYSNRLYGKFVEEKFPLRIEDYSFYPGGNSIKVYYDGKLYDLNIAYIDGLLSYDDLSLIKNKFDQLNNRNNGEKTETPNNNESIVEKSEEELIAEAKDVFLEKYVSRPGATVRSINLIASICSYNNKLFFIMIDKSQKHNKEQKCQIIGDQVFFYTEGYDVKMYVSGDDIYDLKTAYKNGLLSSVELKDIWTKYFYYYYSKRTDVVFADKNE